MNVETKKKKVAKFHKTFADVQKCVGDDFYVISEHLK